MASLRSLKSAIFEREERKQRYQSHIRGLNAFERHRKFVQDYVEFYGKQGPSTDKLPTKTDQDVLREGYRFIPSEEDDADSSWEKRLVKMYYDKLFKEYCIADMSQYKRGKIGLRWRIEKEVVSGKGQFVCGNRECSVKEGLGSYEVNFSYLEAGENKQALVKLVVCKKCAEKLVYKRRKNEEARLKENDKKDLEETELPEVEKDGHKRRRDAINMDESTYDYDRNSRKKVLRKVNGNSSDECDRNSRKKVLRKVNGNSSDQCDRNSKKNGFKRRAHQGEAEVEEFDQYLQGMFP